MREERENSALVHRPSQQRRSVRPCPILAPDLLPGPTRQIEAYDFLGKGRNHSYLTPSLRARGRFFTVQPIKYEEHPKL
jgi:hypothetical protein